MEVNSRKRRSENAQDMGVKLGEVTGFDRIVARVVWAGGNLIDNDIINRRAYRDKSDYTRNGYHLISMFSPIYAALSNSKGAPGDIMFRKTAYELLAEKGYQDGFLPYVSNQYAEEAKRNGDITYSDWQRKDVGLITDSLVLKNVFANQYGSWADFKKDMFNQRSTIFNQ